MGSAAAFTALAPRLTPGEDQADPAAQLATMLDQATQQLRLLFVSLGDVFGPLVVFRLLPVEGSEHDVLDALALVGGQIDRAVQGFDSLLDLGGWPGFASPAERVAAAVADEVLYTRPVLVRVSCTISRRPHSTQNTHEMSRLASPVKGALSVPQS